MTFVFIYTHILSYLIRKWNVMFGYVFLGTHFCWYALINCWQSALYFTTTIQILCTNVCRGSMSYYGICICLRIVESSTYCVVFLLWLSSACVLYLSVYLDCPIMVLVVLSVKHVCILIITSDIVIWHTTWCS
jgi:hypothetical protein